MTNVPTPVAMEATSLLGALAVLDPVKSQVEAIDDIRALEELKAACSAAQAVVPRSWKRCAMRKRNCVGWLQLEIGRAHV